MQQPPCLEQWRVDEAAPAKLNLICLLASVIKDHARLAYFRQLLQSIRAQKIPIDGLFVSIYIDPALGASAEQVIVDMGSPTFILRQRREKRQFLQMADMMQRLEIAFPLPAGDGKERFLLFSDDDDLWHVNRVAAYHALWNGAADSPYAQQLHSVSGMSFKEMIEHKNPNCATGHSNVDVDAMLACGCAVANQSSAGALADLRNVLTEYHSYAVRPYVLVDFLAVHPPRLVKYNRFTDMDFRMFLVTYKIDTAHTIHAIPPHWLYFYRKGPANYCAATNPINCAADELSIANRRDEAQIIALVHYVLDMKESPAMASGLKSEPLGNVAVSVCRTRDEIYKFAVLCAMIEAERKVQRV